MIRVYCLKKFQIPTYLWHFDRQMSESVVCLWKCDNLSNDSLNEYHNP